MQVDGVHTYAKSTLPPRPSIFLFRHCLCDIADIVDYCESHAENFMRGRRLAFFSCSCAMFFPLFPSVNGPSSPTQNDYPPTRCHTLFLDAIRMPCQPHEPHRSTQSRYTAFNSTSHAHATSILIDEERKMCACGLGRDQDSGRRERRAARV